MTYTTGDFGVAGVNSQGWVSKLIKLGALVAGYPADARRFSHAFLIVSDRGDIVEAVKRGVRPAHVSKYDPNDIEIVRMNVEPHDQAQIQAFAKSVMDAKWRYGFLTFAACGFSCLSAQIKWIPTFTFATAQTAICSGFVADALTRAGYIWPKPPAIMMPADLWMECGDRAS